jgi:prophage regulatory protein
MHITLSQPDQIKTKAEKQKQCFAFSSYFVFASTGMPSPFLLPNEVKELTRVGNMTLLRWEARLAFPKRIRLGLRKIAWHRAEVEDWAQDPEAWCRRNAVDAKPIIDNAKQPLASWDDA